LWPLLYSQTKCWMRWKRSVAKSSSFDHLMYSSWCGEPVKSGLLISQSCSKFLLSCDKIQNWHVLLAHFSNHAVLSCSDNSQVPWDWENSGWCEPQRLTGESTCNPRT
jgi:hypothetical protein